MHVYACECAIVTTHASHYLIIRRANYYSSKNCGFLCASLTLPLKTNWVLIALQGIPCGTMIAPKGLCLHNLKKASKIRFLKKIESPDSIWWKPPPPTIWFFSFLLLRNTQSTITIWAELFLHRIYLSCSNLKGCKLWFCIEIKTRMITTSLEECNKSKHVDKL